MSAMLFPILFPIAAGLLLFVVKEPKNRKLLTYLTGTGLLVTGGFVAYVLARVPADGQGMILFQLTKALPVYLKADRLGFLFAAVVTVVWVLAGFFCFSYMEPHKGKREDGEKRFYGFYLIVYGILNGLVFSGNLITFYMFYELMTLLSMPLVLHTGSREAVMAGLKYIF